MVSYIYRCLTYCADILADFLQAISADKPSIVIPPILSESRLAIFRQQRYR